MEQVTTISFFRFNSLKSKIWAFAMMQFAHRPMGRVQGLEFYKLMGTGKARFNPWPDWSVYVILQIWQDEQTAENYFMNGHLFDRYKKNSNEHWVAYCKNRTARGMWD